MARFTVDPDRSTVTVVDRPRLDPRTGPRPASVTGEVEVTEDGVVHGTLEIALDAEPGAVTTIDLAGTTPELAVGPDGHPIVQGRTTRPAGAFGLTGSPLLNPTVQLRWRLALRPV